ncbi:N4BP2L2 [Symbiodinium natans]|uniref:N4BP2L2 protein n=1 Tax=Symbiodinium natans TaxID=878477 RepID=A0A812MH77_9DINO|nr:N4BP2L2 [Symbiodinium natans]
MRGPPGVGKSTRAQEILSDRLGLIGALSLAQRLVHICSTDDFFTTYRRDGTQVYTYDKSKLGRNHAKNQERVKILTSLRMTPIIVDNTNMSRKEMAPYLRTAEEAGYRTRIVDPSELHANWRDLALLVERNRGREGMGKAVSEAVLRKMLSRYEELDLARRAGAAAPKKAATSTAAGARPARAVPRYFGVNLEAALRVGSERVGLVWTPMVAALQAEVAKEAFELRQYSVPAPLHVTTLHASDFGSALASEAALEESFAQEGADVAVRIGSVAFAPHCLACAVVEGVVPALVAPEGKLLHITLATRRPWQPVDSNALLKAIFHELRQKGLDVQAAGWRNVETLIKTLVAVFLQQRCFSQTFGRTHQLQWSAQREWIYPTSGVDLTVAGRSCEAFLVRLPVQPLRRTLHFRLRVSRAFDLTGKESKEREVAKRLGYAGFEPQQTDQEDLCVKFVPELTESLMTRYCDGHISQGEDRSPSAKGCDDSYTGAVRKALANKMPGTYHMW